MLLMKLQEFQLAARLAGETQPAALGSDDSFPYMFSAVPCCVQGCCSSQIGCTCSG